MHYLCHKKRKKLYRIIHIYVKTNNKIINMPYVGLSQLKKININSKMIFK